MNKEDRIKGGMYGLLVGDALGVPYEFSQRQEVAAVAIDMPPPSNWLRAHPFAPEAAWSDDGAQALCLLESLVTHGVFLPNDFSHRLLRWYEFGEWAVNNVVFDVGTQTVQALMRLANGTSPAVSGPSGYRDNGNGSLMRSLPLALWFAASFPEDAVVRITHRQSKITHGHALSQVCCAWYVLWARRVLKGASPLSAFEESRRALEQVYQGWDASSYYLSALCEVDNYEHRGSPQGFGYVVDTLWAARWAFDQGKDYESVVTAAIRLGHDTDTTACVTGGIAGLHWGYKGIPKRWSRQIPMQSRIDALLHQLSTIQD